MKIIIDRDSVCMGDDFGHQQTIECSENETIESLMNKILKSNFFPVEDLKFKAKKWELNIENDNILTYYPNGKKIKYHIDKNISINNIKKDKLFFSYTENSYQHLILLWKQICFIYTKLKQQKWTHIVAPFYLLYLFAFVVGIIYDTIIHDFFLSYIVIICGEAICPLLIFATIAICIALKLLSIKFKNIDKVNNKFLLHNMFYNLLWILGILTLLFGFFAFIYNYILDL